MLTVSHIYLPGMYTNLVWYLPYLIICLIDYESNKYYTYKNNAFKIASIIIACTYKII